MQDGDVKVVNRAMSWATRRKSSPSARLDAGDLPRRIWVHADFAAWHGPPSQSLHGGAKINGGQPIGSSDYGIVESRELSSCGRFIFDVHRLGRATLHPIGQSHYYLDEQWDSAAMRPV